MDSELLEIVTNPYETVKKIAKGESKYLLFSGLLSGEQKPDVDFYDYVSFKELRTQDHAIDLLVGTGVDWNDPDLTIRIKFMWKGHIQGGINVGHPGSNTEYSLGVSNRFFTHEGKMYFDLNGDGHRISSNYTLVNDTVYDVTIGNFYIYDNLAGEYVKQGSHQDFTPVQDVQILFDMAHWWIGGIKIVDSQENVLFDGIAAGKDGLYGLYDFVGGQLHYTEHEAEGHNL